MCVCVYFMPRCVLCAGLCAVLRFLFIYSFYFNLFFPGGVGILNGKLLISGFKCHKN